MFKLTSRLETYSRNSFDHSLLVITSGKRDTGATSLCPVSWWSINKIVDVLTAVYPTTALNKPSSSFLFDPPLFLYLVACYLPSLYLYPTYIYFICVIYISITSTLTFHKSACRFLSNRSREHRVRIQYVRSDNALNNVWEVVVPKFAGPTYLTRSHRPTRHPNTFISA
jgi:hypothetical protein